MWNRIGLLIAIVGISCTVAFPTETVTELVEDVMETTTMSDGAVFDDTEVVEIVGAGKASSDESNGSETTNPSTQSSDVKEFDPNDCFLEKSVGPCRAAIDSWFFNVATHSCESFLWSGCGGNANRFEQEEDCEIRCMNRNLTEPKFVKNETLLAKAEEIPDSEPAASDDSGMTTMLVPQEAEVESSTSSAAPVSSTTTTSASSTTTTTTTTATPVVIFKAKRFDCPVFKGCSPKCIVVQEQSNHGCKTCQCPPATEKHGQSTSSGNNANTEVRTSSSSSSSRSVKVTRSASGAEAPVYVKSVPAVGSVSGLPVKTEEEDESTTETPENVCNLPPTRGHCRAMMTRYRYDAKKKDCIEFHFGGCEGNANNFVSKEKCQEFCKGQ